MWPFRKNAGARPQVDRPESVPDRRDGNPLAVNAEVLSALLTGLMSFTDMVLKNELARLEATRIDREEDRKIRREEREKTREAQRQAAIDTNMKKALKNGAGGLEPGKYFDPENCRVCRGEFGITPDDVTSHYQAGHRPLPRGV